MGKPILGSILLILLMTGTAGAQIDLRGSQSMTIDSNQYSDAYLRDSSSLNVVQGGYMVQGVLGHDSARLNIYQGGFVAQLVMHNDSQLYIDHGTVASTMDLGGMESGFGDVELLDNTVGTLIGATVDSLTLRNNCILTATSTTIGNACEVRDQASVTITGGSLSLLDAQGGTATLTNVNVTGSLSVWSTSHLEMHGGSTPLLNAYSGSTDLFGGSVAVVKAFAGVFSGASPAVVNFYGSDFLATDGLSFSGDRLIGTGTLSGKWLDGSTFSTAITQNTGTIYAIPEPASLSLLAMGGLALLRRRSGYAV